MTTEIYEKKRHFDKTPEPKFRKYDSTFLLSYALPKAKFPDENEKLYLTETEIHPVKYLTFEGEIPLGEYGAGKVTLFDYGEYTILDANSTRIIIEFKGKKIKGKYAIVHTKNKDYLILKVK